MSADRSNPQPDKREYPYAKPMESDSERIIHRHLKDKDDVITDEDIRSVRIGVTDEPSITGAESTTRFKEERPDASKENAREDDDFSGNEPITPIDVLE